MIIVKTSVKPSAVEGLGLFADEKISKGGTIWKFDPVVDIVFEPRDVDNMSPEHQKLIHTYAYLSPESGKYVYPIDNGRFLNHSSTKTNMTTAAYPGETETRGIAMRDIEPGEELFINYRTIDSVDAKSEEEYLNT